MIHYAGARHSRSTAAFCLLILINIPIDCCHGPRVHGTDIDVKAAAVLHNLPASAQPDAREMSAAKVDLGRSLFYDRILSLDYSLSCGSCHRQQMAFSDGNTVSRGVDNEVGYRNAPTIINASVMQSLAWDGGSVTLEQQILKAIVNPVELNLDTLQLVRRLRDHGRYAEGFRAAFAEKSAISAANAASAIASFVRTISSANSPFDRYKRGDSAALSPAARHGQALFFSARTNCVACHSGFNFSDDQFHNTGLFFRYEDRGRFYVSEDYKDEAKFKTPTLRNIAHTAPYMHNGSKASLDEVLAHYNSGGVYHRNKDSLIKPLNLSPAEISDLKEFLLALSDDEVLHNPNYADPNKQ